MTDRKHFVVSRNGVSVPGIIYGTAWKKDRTAELVAQALALGFRGIDTACQPKHYDEPGVGEGVASVIASGVSRDALYLQTKFTSLDGQDPDRVPYSRGACLGDQVAESFAVSLKNLRTGYLDTFILHSPFRTIEETLEVWRAMEKIASAGGARQLGLSNIYNLEELNALWDEMRVKPALVQNRFSVHTDYDRTIRAFCRERGILYQGFWTLTANSEALAHPALRDLAARYRRTPAQVFYRYLTQINVIPLIGTSSPEHMRDDLAIFDFELRDNELRLIGRLLGSGRDM